MAAQILTWTLVFESRRAPQGGQAWSPRLFVTSAKPTVRVALLVRLCSGSIPIARGWLSQDPCGNMVAVNLRKEQQYEIS